MAKKNANQLRKKTKFSKKAKKQNNVDAATQIQKWAKMETIVLQKKYKSGPKNLDPLAQAHKAKKKFKMLPIKKKLDVEMSSLINTDIIHEDEQQPKSVKKEKKIYTSFKTLAKQTSNVLKSN